MAGMIYDALKRRKKLNDSINLFGCSPKKLKEHLESLFIDGMSWGNHGLNGWHIDHIIPTAAFDLSKEEEQKKCFNYTNLVPRWATTEIAIKNGCEENYLGNLNKLDKLPNGELGRNCTKIL
jgi:hypothetical protein